MRSALPAPTATSLPQHTPSHYPHSPSRTRIRNRNTRIYYRALRICAIAIRSSRTTLTDLSWCPCRGPGSTIRSAQYHAPHTVFVGGSQQGVL
eukprot:2790870-Rhodomonas_salina.1